MFKTRKILTVTLLIVIITTAQAQNNLVSWISSTKGNVWKAQTEISLQDYKSESIDIEIYPAKARQTFKSWGMSMNELGWDALNLTSQIDHDQIISNFFAPEGDLGFTFCRIPIGANDYARSWYSLNETDQDFEMEHFNIDRDKTTLIPYIKQALAKNPDIKFWGSPWSPPSWMKTNKHYANLSSDSNGLSTDLQVPPMSANQFIQEPKYLEAYALYFSKFIEAYKEEGINVTAIMYQNEAYSFGVYPNCTWLPDGTIRFNVEYLSPRIKQDHPDVEIFLGTLNSGGASIYDAILSDSRMADVIDGVGFQWEGKNTMSFIHNKYPNYRIMQTESECGYGSFDWAAATHTFSLITQYLFNYSESYTFWNGILADGGFSTWGWKQNALIQINSSTGAVNYTPEYFAVKHFANVVKPGSIVLETNQGVYDNMLAVQTPSGEIAVIIGNPTDNTSNRTIKVGDKFYSVSLDPQSFNTLTLNIDTKGLIDNSELLSVIDAAQTLYDDGTGTNAQQLKQAIDEAETVVNNAVFQNEIDSTLTNLQQTIINFNLDNMLAGDSTSITSLIKNPNFDDGTTSWSRTGFGGNFVSDDATEFWHTKSTLYQNLTLQPGKYILKARAFVDGGDQSFLFAGENKVQLPAKLNDDTAITLSQAAASLQSDNDYQVSLEFVLIKTENITIGIDSKTDTLWTVFDSFELLYLGEDIASYNAILQDLINEATDLYNQSRNESDTLLAAINSAQNVEQTSTAITNAMESLQLAIDNYKIANASDVNPVDFTSKIKNPGFELGLTYWKNTGMATINNDAFITRNNVVLKEGNNFCERWVNTGGTVSTPLGISQTVSDLPVGTYKITVAALSLYRNLANMPADDSPRSGGYIFANDTLLSVGWIEEYEVTTNVIDGDLTIGFKVESPTDGLNWVACDNFRLEYTGIDSTALRTILNKKIAYSTSLLDEEMNSEIAKILNDAINIANLTVNEVPFSTENITFSSRQLNTAAANAERSLLVYTSLQSALDDANTKLIEYTDYPGFDEFNDLYTQVNSNFWNQEYTDEEIPAIMEELRIAEENCKLSQDIPFDVTFLIKNSGFEDITYNVAPNANIPKYWQLDYDLPANKDIRLDHITPYGGLNAYNIWANYINAINLYQDINLPEGNYTLKAAMRTLNGTASDLLTNQHIYAKVGNNEPKNSERLSANGVGSANSDTWEVLTLQFSVPTGGSIVRIGAASNGSGAYNWGGWFQVDEVQLTLDYLTGISILESVPFVNDQIIKIEYFDIQGRRITKPEANRFYLMKKIFDSGRTITEKVIFAY